MIHAFEFWGTRNLHQKCVIRDKVKKIYTTLYNALHQNFYTSCEIFTPAALALLATFSISATRFLLVSTVQSHSCWHHLCDKCHKKLPNIFPLYSSVKRNVHWGQCHYNVRTALGQAWQYHYIAACQSLTYAIIWRVLARLYGTCSMSMSSSQHINVSGSADVTSQKSWSW